MNKIMILGVFVFAMLVACDAGDKKTVKGVGKNSVSVSGVGKVSAQPDVARMNINFSYTAKTTTEAKNAVENIMKKVIATLKENKVEDKDIKTISLNFYTETRYKKGEVIKVGQRAQQTIVATINNIINDPERFPLLIDKITSIHNEIEVENIGFDIENKEVLFKQSRELAYQKAFDKAQQYAELSGRKIGKVLKISEQENQDIAYRNNVLQNTASYKMLEMADERTSYSIPTGEREVSSKVYVTFLLD